MVAELWGVVVGILTTYNMSLEVLCWNLKSHSIISLCLVCLSFVADVVPTAMMVAPATPTPTVCGADVCSLCKH